MYIYIEQFQKVDSVAVNINIISNTGEFQFKIILRYNLMF